MSSANRQTKINACELLHAIVVYMIGKSVSDPDSSAGTSSGHFRLTKIYHNLYPAIFKLACDVDSFARNLFQPLVMQMIHWLVHYKTNQLIDSSNKTSMWYSFFVIEVHGQ